MCCLYRLLIASMQSICLEALGGEKKVDPRLQETTFIQHTFGGRLQSKVCIPFIIPFLLCFSVTSGSKSYTTVILVLHLFDGLVEFNVYRLSVWNVITNQKDMRTLWTWPWRYWVGLSHWKMRWLSLLPLKIWMERICTDVEGLMI